MPNETNARARLVVVQADASHLDTVVELHRLAFVDNGDTDRYAPTVKRRDCFVALIENTALGFAVYDMAAVEL
jgi:hypothetical protein